MPRYLCAISSDYLAFSIRRDVEIDAPDVDAAHESAFQQTGVMEVLEAAGWVFDSSPEGEQHEVEIVKVDGRAYTGVDRVRHYDG